MQKEFLGCVEMHLEPPDDDRAAYAVQATFRFAPDAGEELPGDSIRFSLSVDKNDATDVYERRHTIEFVDGAADQPRGWVRHRMKRVEAMSGRYFWTESRFEVSAPGVPDGHLRQAEVEHEVQAFVDKIAVLDRSRALAADEPKPLS